MSASADYSIVRWLRRNEPMNSIVSAGVLGATVFALLLGIHMAAGGSGERAAGSPAKASQPLGGGRAEISVYSSRYNGRLTASGERYRHHQTVDALTAAVARVRSGRLYRPVLPFGSRVRLTAGGRSVVVRITDTGSWRPRPGHQWFDVAPAAWRALYPGTAPGRRFDAKWEVIR